MNCFYNANILLPKFKDDKEKMKKWATIACDQYTSEPEYWNGVEATVADASSALRVTLPEIYLEDGDTGSRISSINERMRDYTKNVLDCFESCEIYLERTLKDGRVRHGLIGKIDLEAYDYNKGAQTLVRATEGTVLSRIPPRVEIRRGAAIELPHVMMLIDDRENAVMGALEEAKDSFEIAYDFELMQNAGSVKGYFVNEATQKRVNDALEALCDIDAYNKKYSVNEKSPMLFAVGDGNHSLASAKALYEEIKAEYGDAAKDHPARYALVEIVNIHDSALEFEPIYRVVFDTDTDMLLDELKAYAEADKGGSNSFEIECVGKNISEKIVISRSKDELAVGALQTFLDAYLEKNVGKIDYIHGVDSTKTLADADNAVGFIFDGMSKNALFKSVIVGGSLPRKTFSMGEADDKRFYLEARRIVE
ncbi:MAG: DUF1015 domain-containing protein [Clostridia bacterium]|nr:DUF1015 domain-containing protein [Clostridia bacterium]